MRHGGTDEDTAKSTIILNLPISKLLGALSLSCSCGSTSQHRQKMCGSGSSSFMPIFHLYSLVKYTVFCCLSGYLLLSQAFTCRKGIIPASLSPSFSIRDYKKRNKFAHKYFSGYWETPSVIFCVFLEVSAPPVSFSNKAAKYLSWRRKMCCESKCKLFTLTLVMSIVV